MTTMVDFASHLLYSCKGWAPPLPCRVARNVSCVSKRFVLKRVRNVSLFGETWSKNVQYCCTACCSCNHRLLLTTVRYVVAAFTRFLVVAEDVTSPV
jgi:hypothetical protein